MIENNMLITHSCGKIPKKLLLLCHRKFPGHNVNVCLNSKFGSSPLQCPSCLPTFFWLINLYVYCSIRVGKARLMFFRSPLYFSFWLYVCAITMRWGIAQNISTSAPHGVCVLFIENSRHAACLTKSTSHRQPISHRLLSNHSLVYTQYKKLSVSTNYVIMLL